MKAEATCVILNGSVQELLLLERFCGRDEELAAEALVRLKPRLNRVLTSCLRNVDLRREDLDDVLLSTLHILWSRRQELSFEHLGCFWSYARRVARNLAYKVTEVPVLEEEDEIPAGELDLIHTLAVVARDRQLLYQAADELWLREANPSTYELQVLAAQFVLLHKLAPSEVIAILSPYGEVTESDLHSWASDLAILLRVCYGELYWDNDQLADFYLSRAGSWSAEMRSAAALRYRNGLADEKILQMQPGLVPEVLAELKSECGRISPFLGIGPRLEETCRPTRPLSEQGLWKRLVFQYAIHDELPHKHIIERAGKPAEEVGEKLTLAMLNAWLSNGRIYSELGRHVKEAMAL